MQDILPIRLWGDTMISFIRGILEESRPGRLIIDVSGIGFTVLVSDSMREELPSIGNEVKVYTYMSVRDDGMSLYGFLTRDALDLFNMLIGVNGVGPKGALAILDTFSVSKIKFYIASADSNALSKAPTIGKKTAERIIVDLRDKVKKEEIWLDGEPADTSEVGSMITDDAKDAIEALVALGYDRKSSQAAVMKIEHIEELDTNQILKLALSYMY